MDFSLMFFSNHEKGLIDMSYQIMINATKYADLNQFKAVWTPERHFTQFGGLYPNAAITSAALATMTHSVELRGGSVISPLHDVIRLVEEWSVVDNLSKGRIGLSFGSGWNKNDFVLNPSKYNDRYQHMYSQIEQFKKLWSGESIERERHDKEKIKVKIFPSPRSPSVPLWLSISSNENAFIYAGKNNFNILTHLVSQDVKQLSKKISLYREARESSGLNPDEGKISLMLHTYINDVDNERENIITAPFKSYLREIIKMGGVQSKKKSDKYDAVTDDEFIIEELVEISFKRYLKNDSLIGSRELCKDRVMKLECLGVNEVVSLIDFGINYDAVMNSLPLLTSIKDEFVLSTPAQLKSLDEL